MATSSASAHEFPPLHGLPLVLLTISVAAATFMEVLDTTIVNVSVPAIAGSMGVSPSEGTWAVSSYSLAAAVMQPMTGWIGRRFGEVRTFLTSMFLFMVFSALCGLATSMHMLVVGRLIQGLVSGPMVAIAQALLLRNYPPEKRGMALGLWGMVIVSAPIFGPILGGWITDNLSWPWLFYINLPVGALSIAVTWSILHKRESQVLVVPIDYLGLILLAIGIGSLQFMLDNGNDKDWFNSPMIIILGITAVVALTYLVVWELTDKHPILDLQLFKQRNFMVGVVAVSVAYFSFFGVNVVFPLWLQTTLGYTATDAGLAMAPIGLATLFLAPLVGRYSNTMNLRAAVTFSFIVFALVMAWVSRLNGTASFWQLTLPRLWQGIGVAFFFMPLQQILMSRVKPNDLAAAAGLSSFIRTIAGSMSTAITTWLWDDRQQFHRALLTEHIRSDAAGWNQIHGTLNSLGFSDSQALGYAANQISQQGATLAVNDIYMMYALVFLFLIPVVWFARPPFSSGGKAAAH